MVSQHLKGSIEYPNSNSVRVCVRLSGQHQKCAVASRPTRIEACRDACSCVCKAIIPQSSWIEWLSLFGLGKTIECTKMCRPACAQPPRVSRSEFEGRLD